MPRTTRTFVAIPVPTRLGEALTRLQQRLAPQVPAARWVATLPFHMTLAFLGDVEEADLNAVCRAVTGACRPFRSFELRLEGVGVFPDPARPRVLWAGLTLPDGSPLHALQQQVVGALAQIGHRPQDQRFAPHVTLGRIRLDRGSHPPNVTAVLAAHQGWSGGAFRVSEVVTFASTLSREGPEYAPLASAPLAGKESPGIP